MCRIEPHGRWLAALTDVEPPDDPERLEKVLDDWDDLFGDRMQEMVFIGGRLDRPCLRERPASCLLNGKEIAGVRDAASRMEGPFAPWALQETSVEG